MCVRECVCEGVFILDHQHHLITEVLALASLPPKTTSPSANHTGEEEPGECFPGTVPARRAATLRATARVGELGLSLSDVLAAGLGLYTSSLCREGRLNRRGLGREQPHVCVGGILC